MCRIQQYSSVFRCALNVVTVAELFVTGDREFQAAGAMMLNALDWKLILAANWYCSSGLEDLRVRVGSTWLMIMKQVT